MTGHTEEILLVCPVFFQKSRSAARQAMVPPMMSNSSLVMACWRPLLYTTVRSCIKLLALSVAICMAMLRVACSDALESKRVV